jgi:hypothetical protein
LKAEKQAVKALVQQSVARAYREEEEAHNGFGQTKGGGKSKFLNS